MKDMDKTFNRLNAWFMIMFGVMIIFEAFELGLALGERRWESIAINGILLLMWIGSLLIITASRLSYNKSEVATARLEGKLEALQEVGDILEKKQEALNDKEEQLLLDMLLAVSKDITKEHRAPTEEEIPLIEKAFHDNTDKYVQLTLKRDFDGHTSVETEFSEKPFPPRGTKPKATKKAKGESLDGIKKKSKPATTVAKG